MSLFDSASLVVTPNGVKEGKLYSIKPSDGSGDLSVTRATTATRVNSAGLVEVVPYNLLSYSEQFDNGYWEKGNIVTIVQNTTETQSPIGTNNVAKITTNGTGFLFTRVNVYGGTLSETSQSVFVKKANNRYVGLRNGGTGFALHDIFDFDTETWVNNSGSTLSFDKLSNGWYRLKSSRNNSSLNYYYSIIVPNDTSGNEESTVSNLSVYVWGAQAEIFPTAKDYLRTETRLNIPRLDYTNGSCPSILVEPQRTNGFTYSSSFDNSDWAKIGISVTANAITSPSGIQDADKIIASVGNSTKVTYQFSGNGTNTASIYAKAGEFKGLLFTIGTMGAFFNLETGQYRTFYGIPPLDYSIESVGNGWYRCSITYTTIADSVYVGPNDNVSNTLAVNGNGTDGIYVWGAQREAGSYATSYIPTTSASVTRNADQIFKTGISSLIGQTEGTVFLDWKQNGFSNSQGIFANNFNLTGSISIQVGADGMLYGYVCYNNTFFLISAPAGTIQIGQRYKIGFAYKSGNSALYLNGNLIGTNNDSFAFTTTLSEIDLSNRNVYFAQTCETSVKTTAIWKTRLTNETLATLTTI
jgi:hypothetical protein